MNKPDTAPDRGAATDLLTPGEAREYLRLSRTSFYRIAAKHLPRVRMGARAVRYQRADLDAFVSHAKEPAHGE